MSKRNEQFHEPAESTEGLENGFIAGAHADVIDGKYRALIFDLEYEKRGIKQGNVARDVELAEIQETLDALLLRQQTLESEKVMADRQIEAIDGQVAQLRKSSEMIARMTLRTIQREDEAAGRRASVDVGRIDVSLGLEDDDELTILDEIFADAELEPRQIEQAEGEPEEMDEDEALEDLLRGGPQDDERIAEVVPLPVRPLMSHQELIEEMNNRTDTASRGILGRRRRKTNK